MSGNLDSNNYQSLKSQIAELLILGRENAGRAVNSILVQTYWHIGKHIVEFEQGGNKKSEYGSSVLDRLSNDLTLEYGKGFSRSNLIYMRKIFLFYPNRETLSHKLTWSHYFEILKADNDLEIRFYTKESEKEKWIVRELKRQMKSMLFHRIALSKDKEAVLKLSEKGSEIQNPLDIIKDPYVFEFLGLRNPITFSESELETSLVDNLQNFLLELGKGFAFIGRQYRITLSNRHFFVDLVFYHRILKCFVQIDLKKGEIGDQDIGQMKSIPKLLSKTRKY
jgi:predicted nuclease of restriction endonuclease-like (RecB) superfamily